MKWIIIIFTMCTQAVLAQNIVRLEYFIDNDPGYGMGQSLTISANTTTFDILSEIDLNEITTGVHNLYFRVKDENNRWSHTNSQVFLKEATSTRNTEVEVAEMEYFLDEDPGFGSGIPLSITPNGQINQETSLNIAEIDNGFHTIYVRARDNNGTWGLSHSKPFVKALVGNSVSMPLLSSGEYFFDSDPGFGNGIPVAAPASQTLDFEMPLDVSMVGNGVHTLNIRFKDNFSNWGLSYSRSFVKQFRTQREAPADISGIEYYFDTDPGAGNRLSVPFDKSPSIDVTATLNLNGNTTGAHTLFLNTTDDNGISSLVTTREVFIDNCNMPIPDFLTGPTCLGEILAFEDLSSGIDDNTIYSWDFGNDGTIDSNINGDISHLFQQPDVLEVELKLQNGTLCKDSVVHEVNILSLPDLEVGSDVSLCQGDSIQLAATATGTFSWEPTEGLSQADINNPFAKPLSTTEYALTVTSDNGCANTNQLTITVNETYIENVEAQICQGDSIVLEGSYQKMAGMYSDTLHSIFGCDSIVNTALIVNDLPVINLGEDFTLCGNCEETLDAGAGFEEYAWSTGMDVQTITVDTEGEYFAIVTDANGCSNADTVMVDQVLGIDDIFDFLTINLFPNPTDRWINLMINNNNSPQEIKILISNILGKTIDERLIEINYGENLVFFDYRRYPKGLYNIQFLMENGTILKRVLLK